MALLQKPKQTRVPTEVLDLHVPGKGALEQRDRVSGGYIEIKQVYNPDGVYNVLRFDVKEARA